MRKLICAALVLTAAVVSAQDEHKASPLGTPIGATNANITEQLAPVSRTDIYCAGFMTKQPIPASSFVSGGLHTPYSTQFVDRDYLFLKGTNAQPGSLVSIVREVRNPDRFELYPGVGKLIKEAGKPFLDLGYARVTEIRGEVAVAQVEFACQPILSGDLVMPFVERPEITSRSVSTLDRFPADESKLSGQIVIAQNFDQLAKPSSKVYLNIGWEKGVKCGDYYRVTRTYSPNATDIADVSEFRDVMADDTQKNPPKDSIKRRVKDFPRHVVGEIIILNVTPTSATGMVTFALEEIHAGDAVELEPPVQSAQPAAGSN